ncbi:MAG TPA: RidA family protein [Mesorhizobium sp.]|nr:RidA family protein [Mesorhizobium sp.]
MTTRQLVSSGSSFEKAAGYSRAVVQGDWCFVAGTTGYDYAAMAIPEDVESQVRNTFGNISRALEEAGFTLADVARATYYLTDRADVPKIFPILGEFFGDIRPASTMITCGLIDPAMKFEMEVTALKRGG